MGGKRDRANMSCRQTGQECGHCWVKARLECCTHLQGLRVANMIEGGVTPMHSYEELKAMGFQVRQWEVWKVRIDWHSVRFETMIEIKMLDVVLSHNLRS